MIFQPRFGFDQALGAIRTLAPNTTSLQASQVNYQDGLARFVLMMQALQACLLNRVATTLDYLLFHEAPQFSAVRYITCKLCKNLSGIYDDNT